MTQQNAPIATGELRATIRDLDARGQRPSGLVMSPETWARLAADVADRERAQALYDGLPVWVRTDCEGVELIQPANDGAGSAKDDVLWI